MEKSAAYVDHMIEPDNTTVKLPFDYINRQTIECLRRYEAWLNERNIKYSLVRNPIWLPYATGINMRNQDALIFKLTFNL